MNEKEYDAEMTSIMDEYTEAKNETSTSEDSVATNDDQTTDTTVEDSHGDTVDDKPQDEDSESQEEATETTDGEPADKDSSKQKGGGINRKMKQLTKQRRQAERESRETKAKYAELEARLKKFEAAQDKPKKREDLEDFDTLADYQKHLAREEAQRGIDEFKQQTQIEAEANREVQELGELLKSNEAKTRERYKDYDEVIVDFPRDLPLTPEVQKHLAGSPYGPDTMYHMTCNEDVVNAINGATSVEEVNTIVAKVHNQIRAELNKAPAQTETSTATEQPGAQGAALTPPIGKVSSTPPKQGRTGATTGELEDLEGDDFFNEFKNLFD